MPFHSGRSGRLKNPRIQRLLPPALGAFLRLRVVVRPAILRLAEPNGFPSPGLSFCGSLAIAIAASSLAPRRRKSEEMGVRIRSVTGHSPLESNDSIGIWIAQLRFRPNSNSIRDLRITRLPVSVVPSPTPKLQVRRSPIFQSAPGNSKWIC
jgi:hypothetical protein